MPTVEERLASLTPNTDRTESMKVVGLFLTELEKGTVRAAARDADGVWKAQPWVKQGILTAFRIGAVTEYPAASLSFIDKDTLPARRFKPQDGVRIVPGGSSVRRGAYIGKGVVMMPPAYVNIGAFVDDDTMIDSHALVGSCAQIGQRVHVSAAAQIGGVLEPVGALPVVIEDDVLIGGNCGVYEGAIVKRRAVLASGTVLTASTPLYDLPNGTIIEPSGGPLVVPEGAVVVPGTRPLTSGKAREWGLSVSTPIIVKYRDERTDARTALEGAIR
jgi:2,3,4,5-tetrahydropyridine-2-carboxylate N-succinyltransferase